MSDLISRQAAIDAAIEATDSWDGRCNIGRQKRIENYINKLPSAQPEKRTEERTETHGVCLDAISRQAAIDALHTWFRDGFDEDKWWNSTHVLAAIEGLPPAQPEIIQCKDCLYQRICSWKLQGAEYCSFAERREVTT